MTFVKVNNQPVKNFDGIMKDIFNEIPATFGKTFREDVLGFPPVNIAESVNAYLLEVSAPGMEKTDFTIKLDGTLLVISAAKKEEATDTSLNRIRKEFSYKGFKRSFTLDEKIEVANIEAKYENGVLKLTLPKKEETKPASQQITIQ